MATVKELKNYCRKHKLQKWSRLSKKDLEKFVNRHKNKKKSKPAIKKKKPLTSKQMVKAGGGSIGWKKFSSSAFVRRIDAYNLYEKAKKEYPEAKISQVKRSGGTYHQVFVRGNKKVPKKKPKPRMTKGLLIQTIRDDLRSFRPSGYYSSKKYYDEPDGASVDFRDLGDWEAFEDDDDDDDDWDDDFDEWTEESWKKYRKEFDDWGKTKFWNKRVVLLIGTSEKHWAGFQIQIKK